MVSADIHLGPGAVLGVNAHGRAHPVFRQMAGAAVVRGADVDGILSLRMAVDADLRAAVLHGAVGVEIQVLGPDIAPGAFIVIDIHQGPAASAADHPEHPLRLHPVKDQGFFALLGPEAHRARALWRADHRQGLFLRRGGFPVQPPGFHQFLLPVPDDHGPGQAHVADVHLRLVSVVVPAGGLRIPAVGGVGRGQAAEIRHIAIDLALVLQRGFVADGMGVAVPVGIGCAVAEGFAVFHFQVQVQGRAAPDQRIADRHLFAAGQGDGLGGGNDHGPADKPVEGIPLVHAVDNAGFPLHAQPVGADIGSRREHAGLHQAAFPFHLDVQPGGGGGFVQADLVPGQLRGKSRRGDAQRRRQDQYKQPAFHVLQLRSCVIPDSRAILSALCHSERSEESFPVSF